MNFVKQRGRYESDPEFHATVNAYRFLCWLKGKCPSAMVIRDLFRRERAVKFGLEKRSSIKGGEVE